jgi:hypothetical protein
LATTFKKVILLIVVLHILTFMVSISEHIFQKEKMKPAQILAIYMNCIIIIAYLLLTFVIYKTEIKTDMVTLLTCFIFVLH